MTNSTSTSTLATQPEFRSNDVIPDHYLANIVIFFIMFIAISAIAVRVLKDKFPTTFAKANTNEKQILKHTQRLSAATCLHVVEYKTSTFLIVESTNHIGIQAVIADKEESISCQVSEASNGQ